MGGLLWLGGLQKRWGKKGRRPLEQQEKKTLLGKLIIREKGCTPLEFTARAEGTAPEMKRTKIVRNEECLAQKRAKKGKKRSTRKKERKRTGLGVAVSPARELPKKVPSGTRYSHHWEKKKSRATGKEEKNRYRPLRLRGKQLVENEVLKKKKNFVFPKR